MFDTCAMTPLPLIWKTCRKRANTWASGRKSSSRESSPAAISGIHACELRHRFVKFSWVSTVPLGVPVVPDVYTIVEMSSFVRAPVRAATVARGTPAPSATRVSMASESKERTTTWWRPVRSAAVRTISARDTVSVTTRSTSASESTWATCSMELVS